jgi:L-rhamnonate dehydratase
MKIKSVNAVNINFPRPTIKSKPWRDSWNKYAPRILPINKYPQFSKIPSKIPGLGGGEVWVQIIAENGQWGIGRCSFGQPVANLIDFHLAPLLEGQDCFSIEYLNDLMYRSNARLGTGLTNVAQSGIDLALWDLKGKLLDLPVYKLIGGPSRNHIDLYSTGDDLDWYIELGFKSFKITNPAHYEMGIKGLDLVEKRVIDAQNLIGNSTELMINAVMSYNTEFTIRLAERLRKYEIRWIEEPLIPHDIDGLISIKKSAPWMPIATGEDHRGRHSFKQMIESKCVDVVQPDINWVGGLTETLKIYNLAETSGIITIPHGGANSPFGQHFALAMPESPFAEFHMGFDPGIPLDELPYTPGMALPKDGKIIPSDAPGFGIEIKEDNIQPWDHSKTTFSSGHAGYAS